MPRKKTGRKVAINKLRWKLDPKKLNFKTTREIEPLEEIIGQERGVEAFKFGAGMKKSGYNIFVTGPSGTGRLTTVKKLLEEISRDNGNIPDDLCYVNNFKQNEVPILLKFRAGKGKIFKKDVNGFIEALKKEVHRLFEGQEYINRKRR